MLAILMSPQGRRRRRPSRVSGNATVVVYRMPRPPDNKSSPGRRRRGMIGGRFLETRGRRGRYHEVVVTIGGKIDMKVSVRDIAFIAVVVIGAGSLVGGLLRPARRVAASPTPTPADGALAAADAEARSWPGSMKRSGPNGKSRGWTRPRRRPSWPSCGGSRCRYAARSPRWRKSAGSSPGRRAGGSTPGSRTCCTTAVAPITWPSGSPGRSSAPRTARSSSSDADGSWPGSATRSCRTVATTRSSAT